MNDLDRRCLDAFPEWLRALPSDALELARLLETTSTPEAVRRTIAAALSYVFKSLDLIPDGIEDLGYLDDAFVARLAAASCLRDAPTLRSEAPVLGRLANDTALIAELLERDYTRLETHVKALPNSTVRGRTVEEILNDTAILKAFLGEVTTWAQGYATPSFSRDEKNLVKLRAFLGAKLPT